jgi:hypothetical protein
MLRRPMRPRRASTGNTQWPRSLERTPATRGLNLFPAGPIYHARDYLGDDPDPFIRSQILRDLGTHYGGDN